MGTHPEEMFRRRHHDTNQLLRREVHASFLSEVVVDTHSRTDLIMNPNPLHDRRGRRGFWEVKVSVLLS